MNFTLLRSQFADRLRFAAGLLLALLALGFVLRAVLYASFHDTGFDVGAFGLALAIGVVYDALSAIVVLSPLLLGMSFFALRWREIGARRIALLALVTALVCGGLFFAIDLRFGRLHALETLALPLVIVLALGAGLLVGPPVMRFLTLTAFFAVALFNVVVEFYFFEEFNARFNHIALDYVMYPREVGTNLWESYNIPLFAGLALAGGLLLAFFLSRKVAHGQLARLNWASCWRAGTVATAVIGTSIGLLVLLPGVVSANRITNEVAQNGLVQLVRAFFTSELDYGSYYRTLPAGDARARAARVLGFPAPTPDELAAPPGSFQLQRDLAPRASASTEPLDVVVVLEESLGSNVIGVLGSTRGVSPEFDRWSHEGLLLANLVANGNRTVRGLEGVLCSFAPLPGDSITKRTPPAEAATMATVFRAAGYDTTFLYGGAGGFDGMEPFMTKNGWNEFIEQSDLPQDAFKTAWGVADEYIFDALLARHERARAEKKRFFGTLMSVSNHKPYLVPSGRTGRKAGEQTRDGAVAYSDWAIGRYLDALRTKGLLDHTLVLIVGDHGARVYGAELIPVESYRIPALFVAPGDALRGKRFEGLCSQVDLAPTTIALAGIASRAPFLGRDLLSLPPGSPGRAFVQHNRDVGLLTDEVLVVLGLQKTVTFYTRPGRDSDTLTRVDARAVTPAMHELELDAIAVFQTASELYRNGRYVVQAIP